MKRTPEREQFLKDVLITAVEGGINYWSAVSEYDPDNGTVRVHEYHPDTGETENGYAKEGVLVTLDTIAKGIGVIERDSVRFRFAHVGGYWGEFWKANRTNGENGDYDAGIADCIVQAALFGEVVYG
jgi:hypothetical protein